eukprot:174446-Alexandrium_andersonii.AAC.1
MLRTEASTKADARAATPMAEPRRWLLACELAASKTPLQMAMRGHRYGLADGQQRQRAFRGAPKPGLTRPKISGSSPKPSLTRRRCLKAAPWAEICW